MKLPYCLNRSYIPIASTDDDDQHTKVRQTSNIECLGPPSLGSVRLLLLGAVCFSVGYLSCIFFGSSGLFSTYSHESTICHHPSLRQEWRSLSREEKKNYIDAVQCLKDIPSEIGLNQTLYDDFPWVHKHIGEYCPYIPAAPILTVLPLRTFASTSTRRCPIPGMA